MVVDINQRNTGGEGRSEDAGYIQPFRFILGNGIVTKQVLSNFADELDLSAQPLGGHGLIGAFTAGSHSEYAA